MGLNAKELPSTNSGHRQEPLDAGTYPARLVQIIDLGLQKQSPYKGEEKPPCNELYTTYELLDEFCVDEDGNVEEDRPRWVSERYPFHSLEADRARSTHRYMALDPDEEHEGDWTQLVATPCMINLTATEGKGKNANKVFNNIDGVSSMRTKDADKAEPLKNDPKIFSLDEPDMEIFMKLPKFLQDIIKDNLDYEGSDLEKAIANYKEPEEEKEEKKKPTKKKPVKKATKKVEEEKDEDDDGEW